MDPIENERQKGVDRLIYGCSYEDASGRRIDPLEVEAALMEQHEKYEGFKARVLDDSQRRAQRRRRFP